MPSIPPLNPPLWSGLGKMNEPGKQAVGSQAPKDARIGTPEMASVPSAGDALTNYLWLEHTVRIRQGLGRYGMRFDIEFRWDISNEMSDRKDKMPCTEYACAGGALDFVHSTALSPVSH